MRFQCTQCGNCCRNHGDYTYVYVTEPEIRAISTELGLSRRDFLREYCTKEEQSWYSLRMDRPACPFLGEDNRCGIYAVRPMQCRTWPFWEENLKREVWEGAVRACCPGVDTGKLYPAAEVERQARATEENFD